MRTRTKQIIPNPADDLSGGEDMTEPGEYPGDDEHQHPHLCEALEYLPHLGVVAEEQLQDQLADRGG